MDCIHLAQDRNKWQAYMNKVMDLKWWVLVSTVMNFWVP